MRAVLAAIAATAALTGAARGEGEAGVFDYYVLSLSWSPNWCALEGDARGAAQCGPGEDFGWVLHGLWPQYDSDYPQDCRSRFPPPDRAMTGAMADIMGSPGLAWHQWTRHGSCSGLAPGDYFALARLAFDRVVRPEVFERLDRPVTLSARVVQEAFLRENEGLEADGITITCRSGHIQEARVCLTRELTFRLCGADVVRDCTLEDATFEPVP